MPTTDILLIAERERVSAVKMKWTNQDQDFEVGVEQSKYHFPEMEPSANKISSDLTSPVLKSVSFHVVDNKYFCPR